MTKEQEKQKRIDDRQKEVKEAAVAKRVEDRKTEAWQNRQPDAALARCNAIRDRQVQSVNILLQFCSRPKNSSNMLCQPGNPQLQYPPPCVKAPVCTTCPRPM